MIALRCPSDHLVEEREMVKVLKASVTVLFLVVLAACHGVVATHDHSRTIESESFKGGPPTIVVATIPEFAAVNRLSKNLSTALVEALQRKFEPAQVHGPDKLKASLLSNEVVDEFARWRSAYRQTGVLDPKLLATIKKAITQRYLLLPLDTYVDREKISFKETECKGACWYNPDNIWRTKLKMLVDLIDMDTGAVVWRGVGEARHIQDGGRTLDFGLVLIIPGKGEDVETLVEGKMIRVVAQGIARELGSFLR
jgi:hypothetical protein